MNHRHLTNPSKGRLEHLTGDEWNTAVGDYDNTQIYLRRDDNLGNRFELVICDHVDYHSKFWRTAKLEEIEEIGLAIVKLVKAAKAKK